MVWQIITVLYFLLSAASAETMFGFLRPWSRHLSSPHQWVGFFIVGFTTILTLVSGFSYFWKNKHLFNDA